MTLPLEHQVSNKELSQRLKELGVKQESTFYWLHIPAKEVFDTVGNRWFNRKEHYKLLPFVKQKGTHNETISAFTVAEIGQMLGKTTMLALHEAYMKVMDLPVGSYNPMLAMHNVMTQPNIPTKMLIYLIENKLITL